MNTPPTQVQFNALPQGSRERLVAALQGKGPLPHLAFTPYLEQGRRAARLLGWITALIATLCFLAYAFDGYGDPRHGWARWNVQWLALLTAMIACLTWLALRFVRGIITRVRCPVPLGTYLLPLDIVEVHGPTLRILPLSSVSGLQATRHFLNGAYQGTSVAFGFPTGTTSFMMRGEQTAMEIQRAIPVYQQRAHEAMAQRDGRTLWELDPLFEARSSAEWPSLQRVDAPPPTVAAGPSFVVRPTPAWLKRPSLAALAFALVTGPAVWAVRNRMSDEAIYASLRSRASARACEGYIALGGRHVDEVRDALLPAAAYRETARDSVHWQRMFIQRFPRSPQAGVARARVHQLFEDAHASWRAQATTRDPALIPFMARLLTWEEAHDSPPVQMRFFPPSSEALATVDAAVASNQAAMPGRAVAPIAPHFTDAAMRPREGRVVSAMQGAFHTAFQRAMLPLDDGGRLAEGAAPPRDAPVFDVSYVVSPSGSLYTVDTLPARAFVGILFTYRVTMRVPDGGPPFAFTASVRPDRDISFRTPDRSAPSDAFIYGVMSDSAFGQLADRFRGVFFQTPGGAVENPSEQPTRADAPPTPEGSAGGEGTSEARRHRRHRRHH